MLNLHSKSYSPVRGGHAPGHLRDAFVDAVDAYAAWKTGEPEPVVDLGGANIPVSRVFGMLWCCTDVLPGHLADTVNDHLRGERLRRHTYAAAARALKATLG